VRFRAVFCSALVSIALGVFQSAAGEPSAPTNTSSTPTNTTGDFDSLVKRGDQARLKRDFITAIKAYRDALALRDDSLIEGRLGLLLFEMREFDVAAQRLHYAVEKPSKAVSDAEFARFSSALRAAQKEVCRIDVEVDRRGTRLEVDGDVVQEGKGEYWFYVAPGKHTLRVTLEGFEDELREVDAPKGEQMPLKFTMRPIVKPAPEPEKPADPPPLPPPLKTTDPTPVPIDKPPAKTNAKPKGGFVVGGGVAFVFEATPKPALGPQAFVAWRSRSWWELGIDARVSGMFVEDDRFPDTGFVTWSAGLTPCARLRDRFFGCALLQLDGLTRTAAPGASILPALGFRGGIELAASAHVRFQGWAEAALHYGGFSMTDNNKWIGFPVTGSLGLRAAYAF